jgi:ABC-2 type transport system permease protein/sodium transport system permease protein
MATKVLANVLLFACLPLASAWLRRVRFETGFRLEGLGLRVWGAAVLLGLCLWPFADLVQQALRALKLGTLNEYLLERVELSFQRWRELPVVAVVLCSAVVPAVLEEFFFRGYLFSALRSAGTVRAAIVGSAIFFGLFHLVGQVVSVEAGVVSTLLGLVLGWLSWRAGSIVPGMILHALHNASLILLAYYKPALIRAGWFHAGQTRLPVALLLAAGAGCLLALGWLALASRGRRELPPALVPTDAGG